MKLPGIGQSLTARLTWFAGLGTLLVWTLLTLSTLFTVRHEFGEMLDHRLQHVARLLLTIDTLGRVGQDDGELDPSFSFAVYAADGRLLTASHQPALPLLAPGDNRQSRRRIDYQGARWQLAVASNAQRTVIVGELIDWQEEVIEEVLEHLGWPALAALLLLLALLYLGVRRGLAPLQTLRSELAARTPQELAPLESPAPREIRPLTEQLNSLFAAVRQVMAREQRFTADAAHELRTPLAALQIQLDVASSSPRPEARERALRQAHAGVARATQLVNQLLELARLEHLGELHSQPLDLAALAMAAAREDGDGVVQVSGACPLRPPGDAALFRLLLRNLIDNARRYGATPVMLQLHASGLTVADCGPGVDADTLARLGERFFRPPGQAQTGAGLGLSIVQRIATLHGAQLRLYNQPDGGFAVSISWPAIHEDPSTP
ncbi:ATP-binding protein [Chitinilyticum litopenaei]|uniref:ATP-binding protein n=1 Tax=Chitinilyticum litopenaei TaxID=1121276 RepID=UPI00041CF845|nr:ATP-binding protein [Chitinilyticum litopenaei]